MPEQRTFRVQASTAPRLVFELSRLGASAGRSSEALASVERERYELDGALVSVDHVTGAGWFCTIEADDTVRLEAAVSRLGLRADQLEPRSYAELTGSTERAAAPSRSFLRGPGSRSTRILLMLLCALAVGVALDPLSGLVAAIGLLLLEWWLGRGSSRDPGRSPPG